ncbi:MAG TPA: lactate/malate dehydrogenase family protein [Tepidisphaeraceae bacterium]|jgi:L-lactate dehydrogenase|nr:lactate/malate dehydrogenase family protein [Tepidisphaeraceae bacterium]
MKVSIIGGGGRVGSNTAFALQCAGIVSEIHILDANEQMAAGEALDLLHGASVAADQKIYAGNYEKSADADMIVITAGLRRKPDESRLDLINRNVTLFKQILDSINGAGLKKDAIVMVVSNPVDILTRLAIDYLKCDPDKVIGLGTQLDTARFRSLIALETELPPTQIKALILGEHGDSMVPIWSSATAGGILLVKLEGFTAAVQQRVFDRTKGGGAEAIKLKGGAGWAVALSIAEVIHPIALSQPKLLPISTQLSGEYGVRGTCMSVPTVVGRSGVIRRQEVELWPREISGLQASAKALDATYAQVQKKD